MVVLYGLVLVVKDGAVLLLERTHTSFGNGLYGLVGGKAAEAIGRQPEAEGKIRGTMILAAALIEGVALFGEVIAIILANK